MANKISVIVDVTVDRASRALNSFKQSVNNADGAVNKLKAGAASASASLKANMLPAAAAAGAALFKMGSDAVAAASSLEQSIGGVEKAFGDAAEAVLAIGENADESMGLSQRAFNEGALALSAFAEDIARDTGEPVADVIQNLMTRAADFAAAYGTTVPDAVRIFSSTLSGESEPIKRFGIIVNETETKAYAAEAGLDAMGKTTQRAGLLMEDTAKFAGQFADESDTLAGSQERLGAKIENLQASLGEDLLPVVADAAGTLSTLLTVWQELGDSPPVKLVVEVSGNDSLLGTIDQMGRLASGVGWAEQALDGLERIRETFSDGAAETTGTVGDMTVAVDENAESSSGMRSELAASVLEMDRMRRQASETGDEVDDLTDSFEDLRDEISDENAYLDAVDGFDDVRDAAFDAYTTAAEESEDAEQKARDYQRAINDQKLETLNYIETLEDIPEEKTSEILALIDQGKVDEAEAALDRLARRREVFYQPVTLPNRFGRGGVMSHTGSRFEAGETKQVVPGQVFTPDVPGRMSSVEESGRMTAPHAEAGPDPAHITLVIEGKPFTAMLDERDRAMVARLRAGKR